MKNTLHSSSINSLEKIYQGKVRDVYKIDEDNINSDILHIFPITLSSTIILFLSLYYFI